MKQSNQKNQMSAPPAAAGPYGKLEAGDGAMDRYVRGGGDDRHWWQWGRFKYILLALTLFAILGLSIAILVCVIEITQSDLGNHVIEAEAALTEAEAALAEIGAGLVGAHTKLDAALTMLATIEACTPCPKAAAPKGKHKTARQ